VAFQIIRHNEKISCAEELTVISLIHLPGTRVW
jgi:hypothetical protein